jgi:hypothetical protein
MWSQPTGYAANPRRYGGASRLRIRRMHVLGTALDLATG